MNHTAETLASETLDRLPHVDGVMNYMKPMADKPHNYTYEPPAGTPPTNVVLEPHTVPVRDVRSVAGSLSVDREGVQLVECHSAVTDFYDEQQLHDVYYPETEKLVAEATGASRVVIFDHTVRKRQWGRQDRAPGAARQPVPRVHNDYTETSGPQRVRDLMGDEAETLLKGRYAVINVWRPIRGPLKDAPLAVCDAMSVRQGDFVASDLLYKDRTGETYAVTFNPNHRWYYVSDMSADEALLLKCYDSAADGTARFAPHTAFEDPAAPADKLPRESIELRTLVFFEE